MEKSEKFFVNSHHPLRQALQAVSIVHDTPFSPHVVLKYRIIHCTDVMQSWKGIRDLLYMCAHILLHWCIENNNAYDIWWNVYNLSADFFLGGNARDFSAANV